LPLIRQWLTVSVRYDRNYRKKVTGAHGHRRELLKLLKCFAPGDVVMVTRIDRLARSTFDLSAIVKRIADAKAQFRSLAEPWADTGTSTGRLMIAVPGGLLPCRPCNGFSKPQSSSDAPPLPP
jgi:DNA invertase Pin-like site-specific DNA recombinase